MAFLRKKSVGLHLSSDAVRLAVLYKKGKQITAGLFRTEPLTEDVVKDGKIRDYQKFKKLLLSLKKKVGFDKVNFSFDRPESDLFKEIKIKVLWFEEEASAAARAILPIRVDSLDIRDNSLLPVMLVDIGSDRTIVSVISGGEISYCEKLQISSSFIKDLIERGLGLDLFTEEINKHYLDWHLKVSKSSKLSLPRASETSLRGKSSQPQEGWNLHFSPSDNKDLVKDQGLRIKNILLYGSALKSIGENLRLPARRSLGAGGDLRKSAFSISEYLTANLKVPVEIANVWTNIISSFDDKIPSISFNESLKYATAIGLALKGFE